MSDSLLLKTWYI